MTLQSDAILLPDTSQVPPTPSINNTISVVTLQFRNLAPHSRARRARVLRVQHQHQSALQSRRRSGPVLSWVGGIESPVGVVTPFVGMSRAADKRILMEIQQVLILQNVHVGGADGIELRSVSMREMGRWRGKQTAVPMIKGPFIIAHKAKCALVSAVVRSPLPTSSMSGSG